MDSSLEIILKDSSQRLKEFLYTWVTKNESSILGLTIKVVEELFVFACYTGSLNCLLFLLKFDKLKTSYLQNSPHFANVY